MHHNEVMRDIDKDNVIINLSLYWQPTSYPFMATYVLITLFSFKMADKLQIICRGDEKGAILALSNNSLKLHTNRGTKAIQTYLESQNGTVARSFPIDTENEFGSVIK